MRRVHIPKPGTNETRPLGIPTVRDRVVQAAIVNVIEPIFERDFAEHSYGFRPGRGCKDALRRVDELLQGRLRPRRGRRPERLLRHDSARPADGRACKTKIADGRVLALIEAFLKADILDEASTMDARRRAHRKARCSVRC